jgi:steroid 5-alpha reductase family enzyme
MQVLWLWGLGLFATLLFMALLWCVYFFKRNAGLLDLGWVVSFIINLGVALYWGIAPTSSKVLLALMVVPWAARLLWHLWDRFNIQVEDLRYTRIRNQWGGDDSGLKFLSMFLVQGIFATVISLPFYLIAADPGVRIGLLAGVGFAITLIGFVGETMADKQLKDFKKKNRGKVCDTGLWGHTRHPNYFFEWLVWVGLFCFALSASYGFFAILSPLLMYYLLRYLSGIPPLEAHMAKVKGEAWVEYTLHTPVFFPKIK